MLNRYTCALLAALPLVLLAVACASDPTPTSIPTATPVPTPTLQQYDSPPPLTIDPDKSYTATLELQKGGVIVIELFAREAPVTVNNFIFLARESYYDGVTFHRVIPGFMAQGGDPTGTGRGGPGYTIPDEFSPLRRHDGPGVLSMANVGRPDHRRRPVVHHLRTHAAPGRCPCGVRTGDRGDGRGERHIATRPRIGHLARRRDRLYHHSRGRVGRRQEARSHPSTSSEPPRT